MAIGIERRRPLNHPRQRGRFGQIDLAEIFGEKRLGGFAESVNLERAVRAQMIIVGVISEDLFLR